MLQLRYLYYICYDKKNYVTLFLRQTIHWLNYIYHAGEFGRRLMTCKKRGSTVKQHLKPLIMSADAHVWLFAFKKQHQYRLQHAQRNSIGTLRNSLESIKMTHYRHNIQYENKAKIWGIMFVKINYRLLIKCIFYSDRSYELRVSAMDVQVDSLICPYLPFTPESLIFSKRMSSNLNRRISSSEVQLMMPIFSLKFFLPKRLQSPWFFFSER